MSTTADKVRAAKSPQEALLALAEGIDRLHAKLDEQPGDEWTGFFEERTHYPPESRDADLARLREQLAETADEDERRALAAKIRLLEDDGAEVRATAAGKRVSMTVGEEETIVELPAVSDEIKARRRKLAERAGLEGEFIEHYATGGPLWLYLGDRSFVMGLPEHMRKEMVNDVLETSPGEAHDLARDILKSEEANEKSLSEFE